MAHKKRRTNGSSGRKVAAGRNGAICRRPNPRASSWRGAADEPLRRASSRLVADHRPRCRRLDLARVRPMASRLRGGFRQEEAFSQRDVQRDHARRPLFPGRQRLHAHLRPDEERQSRARIDLSPGRLFRLHDSRRNRIMAVQLCRGFRRRRAPRHPPSGRRLPPDGGAGPSSNPGDNWHCDCPRRPDALGFRRELLANPDAGLAARTNGASVHHRGQVFGRERLSFLSDRATGHLRRFCRDRPGDVACTQSHPHRHDRAAPESTIAICSRRWAFAFNLFS